MTYTKGYPKEVAVAVHDILEADLPARLAAASYPPIVTWTYQDVVTDVDALTTPDLWPQCVIHLAWGRRPVGGATAFANMYDVNVIVAFEWVGNLSGYLDGMDAAAMVEAIMFDHVCHSVAGVELWTAIINSSVRGEPVGEVGEWQGGAVRMTLGGGELHYS